MSTPVATATPSRERSSTSQSASSPMTMRPQASSSAASVAASTLGQTANTTTYPITLETLLATHASAPNPILAALDQVLSERNVLSTQNTQLWKLIEKQRAAYNQVLKEIERVRSERDTYKTRLQAAGMGTELAKKEKDREKDKARSLRSSESNATMSSMSVNGSSDLRSRMVRNQLDATSSPSRNDDRPVTPPCLPETNTRDSDLQTPQTPQTTMSTRPFNSPLVVPPRGISLSLAAASAATSSSGATSPGSTSQSSIDLDRPPVPRTTDSRPPSQQPSAPPPSLQSVHLPPPVSLRPAHPLTATLQPPTSSINTLIVIHGSAVSPNGSAISPTNISSTASQTGLLSPTVDNSQQPSQASRISSVSLPDEAKLYITNLGESPLPSPSMCQHMAGFSDDMQCHAGQESLTPRTESPTIMLTKEQRDEVGEFLDMDDDEREDETIAKHSNSKNKPHAAVEDFPMPPSHGAIHIPSSHVQPLDPALMLTPTQSNPQPSAAASTPSRAHWQPHRELLQSDNASVLIPESPLPTSYLSPINPTSSGTSATFRALPLLPDDLVTTRVAVSHSSVKPNDRGKEVLSFVVDVHPGHGKEPWKVEKLYSDVLTLDNRMRASVGKGIGKKMAILPEGKIWRDHAPAKSDQRKVALEVYLQSLVDLPVKNKDEIIAFFTSDIVRETHKPVMQAGHKEGYLTKRGKNFGGWKSRYFVLQGPVLEYYESRGGAHLGSIVITSAQIGRQQRTADNDDERNYRHAFLIIEAKKAPNGSHSRHVLCAESDVERDSWVDILVRYVSGTFNEDPATSISASPSPISINVNVPPGQGLGSAQPRSSTSSTQDGSVSTPNGKRAMRTMSKDDILRGAAVPISQLVQDGTNAKLFHSAPVPGVNQDSRPHSASPTKELDPSAHHERDHYTAEETARRILERGLSSGSTEQLSNSLPTSSPLEGSGGNLLYLRANSELGHYSDLQRGSHSKLEPFSPENKSREQRRDRKSVHPGLSAIVSPTAANFSDRAPSPEPSVTPLKGDRAKISAPMNGAPIPAGYKFGGKDPLSESFASSNDRREKAKSRSFWNFGRPVDKAIVHIPRAVFGVPLEESIEVAEIARLPAVVFRCIQYLEAKKADQEEGIYRLSGSSAVIKGLKDRFNAEGDVDLVASDEYWDPHAIAGLLKSFLRELPASILTRELHLKFLAVIDFVDAQERIRELSDLIASLPIANYSLLRALTAHLILIVQNSSANKMTMRNVGIVFSPTLGIPAGVFSLMLGEFNRVFNVDSEQGDEDNVEELSRRNSRQYTDAAADQLLGLSGRTLNAPSDETPSDSDSISLHYESGNDTTEDATIESNLTQSSARLSSSHHHPQDSQQSTDHVSLLRSEGSSLEQRSRASNLAASRGLNIAVGKKGNRHSRMIGLPASARLPVDAPSDASSPIHSPMHTARHS
ncbi:uncharacterized protein F5891DRAFT_996799 [Suillus fuscotomentosus]|uniref:RhoGAP-domain-containing protein n=1 Tax=Suillus fuscotomentosus TaxID=1912939 RepID=A0AAD4EKJ1_9AGAM|nr:uncharacterized protein F5891DRAFT_996799 [Suillus fuscotomentosus]KAG1907741.1 hypothetical protein F5891DRAFT_996799 [Suillus fuscotomentosus]